MLRTFFNEKHVHSLSVHHTRVKLKARPFQNQLRDEKELISRGQRSASNINIYISQYAAWLVHCKIGFIRDAARRRNMISHTLFKESCHESTTHNLLIKYDRLGGSDPRRAPPPLPQHLAYYVQGAVPVPPPHKYVILDSDVLQETDKEGEVSIKTACNMVLSFRRWLSVLSREYVGKHHFGVLKTSW